MNQFPHTFLQLHRRETIPLALVYVYVAVARRLGIQAGPANFPGAVQVHIQPPDPSEWAKLMDVRSNDPPLPIPRGAFIQAFNTTIEAREEFTRPATTPAMLTRAANNIIMFMRYERIHDDNMSSPWSLEAHESAFYATSCWFIMESQPDRPVLTPPESKPLDAVAVVLDAICPALDPVLRGTISTLTYRTIELEEERANNVTRRSTYPSAKYFVGLVFLHAKYSYVGCIFAWDVSF